MAGLQGLGAGFIQGYGLVSDIQDRKERRGLQRERLANEQSYREQRMGLLIDEAARQKERDAVSDERWDKTNERADRTLAETIRQNDRNYGLNSAKTAAAVRSSNASTRASEIEIANAAQERREAQNRRHLEAAALARQQGDYATFREQAKKGNLNVDRFVDPEFVEDVEILKTIAQTGGSAPISAERRNKAFGNVFRNRVDAPVGSKTPDGRTIISSEVAGIYPSEDGNHYRLDLKLKARDKNGKITEYHAPVTPTRSPDDLDVLDISLDKTIGHVAAIDFAIRATDPEKLNNAIEREKILNGAKEAGAEGDFSKLSNNRVLNKKTGQVIKIDDTDELYSTAMDMAQNDLQAMLKDPRFAKKSAEEQQRYALDRRNFYLTALKPESSNPSSKAEYEKLPSGAQFVAPDGTVRVKP